MNAPLGRTPEKPLGKCECWDYICHDRPCTRDAVRLVPVRVLLGTRPNGRSRRKAKTWEESRDVAMCEPCAQHHECASHTERTTAKGGRE